MSEAGYILINRDFFDHGFFADEPFTEREAWVWLIVEAAWRDRRKRVGNTIFDLKRGQLACSIRFMAVAWQWNKDKVARFLVRLKTETMIETQARRDATVITLCNYNKYQLKSAADATLDETPTATPTRHQRDKLEDINTLRKEEDTSLRSVSLDDFPVDYRERFWKAYPRKAGKAAAVRKLETIRKARKVTFAALMAGVDRYAIACLQIETQFQKHPATWLNAGCWDDDVAALKRATGPPRNVIQGFESLFQQHASSPHEPDSRTEYDLDLTANRAS